MDGKECQQNASKAGLVDLSQLCRCRLLLLPQLETSGKRTHVHASPFSRTVETARECARACQLDDTEIHVCIYLPDSLYRLSSSATPLNLRLA